MTELPEIVAEEQEVLDGVLPALKRIQEEEADKAVELRKRRLELHKEWTNARGDPAQREAFEEALVEAERREKSHAAANRSRELPLASPYFARMVLEEKRRSQTVLLGKVGVVGQGLAIVDWRNAPVSRLYYDYDEGDEFEEEFGGKAREGTLSRKRRADIRAGRLEEVQAGEVVLRRNRRGEYAAPDSAKADRDDHRLPDIVSLITREQFAVITRAEAGVVLLRGRAGSGKTTVALHRIAWLHYQDPVRFAPDKVLVVMFNKALQTYISGVLPELGLKGVPVETFHGWAGRCLRQGGIELPFRAAGPKAAAISRLKRHPTIEALIRAQVDQLGEKTAAWVQEQLSPEQRAAWDATAGQGLARLHAYQVSQGALPAWTRLRARLLDHGRDLFALFDDEALCQRVLPPALHALLPAAREHQARNAAQGCFDWEDAALLLRLGQLKRAAIPTLPCPWAGRHAHIVIDEAQDLSTVELEALVDSADAGRSVTIAGDPAQKILADAQFEGFEELLQRLAGELTVRLDALAVGHRSTLPIMALALQALQKTEDPSTMASRDGAPVEWISEAPAVPAVVAALRAFREERPKSLVAVLARGKATADTWASELKAAGLADVRRAERSDFHFTPGVVVSNVHQVKGLEFDGVLLIEPADFGVADRHLLHVAITRAADRLWVVATRGRGLLR